MALLLYGNSGLGDSVMTIFCVTDQSKPTRDKHTRHHFLISVRSSIHPFFKVQCLLLV